MDPQGMLKLGIVVSVLGVLLSLLAGLFDNTGLDDALRPIAGVATLFGLLFLVFAVYALAAPASMPPLVLAGAVLFLAGRLGSIVLSNVIDGFNPTIGLLFTALGLASGIGTIVLFYGVYQVVRARLPSRGPQPLAPAAPPRAAPRSAPPGPRRSAFRPPQAPLPPSKAPGTQAPKPR